MHKCKWVHLAALDQMAHGLGSVVAPELPGHEREMRSAEGSS